MIACVVVVLVSARCADVVAVVGQLRFVGDQLTHITFEEVGHAPRADVAFAGCAASVVEVEDVATAATDDEVMNSGCHGEVPVWQAIHAPMSERAQELRERTMGSNRRRPADERCAGGPLDVGCARGSAGPAPGAASPVLE